MSPKASTRLLATQSDERLAAMARAGHDRAFEALVHRYRPPLLRYCRRLSIPDSRAEDVVQQALLQAWSALRRGAAVRELRPWLYRIAHNTAINLTRDSARDGSGAALDLDSVSAGDSAVLIEPDLAGGLHLRDALTDMAALPDLQREVIFRTALAGHSHQEVATALGITDGAVRGLLYRARATLRTAVTAITPPPLIAWISGPGQGIATDRLTEIAAGGGLGAGMLAKGALALLAAGTLITGAAIVHSPPSAYRHTHATHTAPAPAKRQIAAFAAPSGTPLRSSAPAVSHSRAGSALRVSAARRSASRKPVRLRIAIPAPSGPSRSLALAHRHSSAPPASSPAPTSTTLHIPASSTTPSPGSGSSSSGSSSGAGGGSSGSGSSGSGPSSGGSSGGGSGTGTGGSGGSGSGGGTSGGGSSGGGSNGGGSGGGSQPESSPPPPSSGSGSASTGPVTTVVHEVTGLLEHTVHGILGH